VKDAKVEGVNDQEIEGRFLRCCDGNALESKP
jgi:hypothetical protein